MLHTFIVKKSTQSNALKTILQDKEASKYASFGNNVNVLNGNSPKYLFIMPIICTIIFFSVVLFVL